MTTLHLGVIEMPYSSVGEKTSLNTGDVATFLEDKYHVMKVFFDIHGQEIADGLTEGLAGALENLMAGAPMSADPFGTATSMIETKFTKYIDNEEIKQSGEPGVPTAAAEAGYTLRKKKRYKGVRRPSFVYSSLYRGSFKAWVETP